LPSPIPFSHPVQRRLTIFDPPRWENCISPLELAPRGCQFAPSPGCLLVVFFFFYFPPPFPLPATCRYFSKTQDPAFISHPPGFVSPHVTMARLSFSPLPFRFVPSNVRRVTSPGFYLPPPQVFFFLLNTFHIRFFTLVCRNHGLAPFSSPGQQRCLHHLSMASPLSFRLPFPSFNLTPSHGSLVPVLVVSPEISCTSPFS